MVSRGQDIDCPSDTEVGWVVLFASSGRKCCPKYNGYLENVRNIERLALIRWLDTIRLHANLNRPRVCKMLTEATNGKEPRDAVSKISAVRIRSIRHLSVARFKNHQKCD